MTQFIIRERWSNYAWRVQQLVDSKYQVMFEYGQHDCALWGADAMAVQFQDGYDIATKWRGKYKTLKGGMGLIKRAGYRDYIDVFARELPTIPASMAQTGDLVIVNGIGDMESIGVCVRNVIYAPTESSLGIMPLSRGIRAFAVGREADE